MLRLKVFVGSIRGKLLGLLSLSLTLSFMLAAATIASYINHFHAEALEQRFYMAALSLKEDVQEILGEHARDLSTFSSDQGIIASLNLLSSYDVDNISSGQIFDAEKRKLLNDLKRLTRNKEDTHILLDADFKPLALHIFQAGKLVEAYAGSSNAPQEMMVHRPSVSEHWLAEKQPELLDWLNGLSDRSKQIQWVRAGDRLAVVFIAPIFKTLVNDTSQRVGFIVEINEITSLTLLERFKYSDIAFSVHASPETLPAGLRPGDGGMTRAPGLLDQALQPRAGWVETKDFFASVFSVSLTDGKEAFFVFSADTGLVHSQVIRAVAAIVAVLFVSTVLVVWGGHVLATRWISNPVRQLVSNIDAVRLGNYQGLSEQQDRKDELGLLSNALVGMAKTVQDREQQVLELNADLEQRVKWRTAELQEANRQLALSVEELSRTQNHLVQSEKMAALGGLVAGVAHEINTPLGTGVTAASYLDEKIRKLAQQYQENNVTRQDLTDFIDVGLSSNGMVLANLKRASELVRSFKQVAVDQTGAKHRRIFLKEYLAEVIHSLQPQFSHYHHEITLECPEELELYCNPGDLAQMVTNFVMNSLIHGFENVDAGHIRIEVSEAGGEVVLRYRDDGKGIAQNDLTHVFEPFYTTKRGTGGSGLGLYVVYNIVTQGLKGRIECRSEPGAGVEFDVRFPKGLEGAPLS